MKPKDFQEATAERIIQVFMEEGQQRILLADEVGLGKTIVASAVVKKLSQLHRSGASFKVVYVCSNANIANQNYRKLGIREENCVKFNESRLSMQHLKIYEQLRGGQRREQLIPLTPATSFTMAGGQGTKSERALMFVLLSMFRELPNCLDKLNQFMKFKEDLNRWDDEVCSYKEKVFKCDVDNKRYLKDMMKALRRRITNKLYAEIMDVCTAKSVFEVDYALRRDIINNLRRIFAQISLDKLNPDLVVMDEFQRFKDLIAPADDESGMLSKKFLTSSDTKVLLLSATPYKPYSTLEELSQGETGHYEEFLKVIDFLLYDSAKNCHFKEVWSDYSNRLHELNNADCRLSVLLAGKKPAEDALYACMARTERRNDGMIDDSKAVEIKVTSEDILSYVEMQRLLEALGLGNFPIEYVKSAPYLLSFMNYKIKERIVGALAKTGDYSKIKRSGKMLLQTNAIHDYRKIPANNARLQLLEDEVFGAASNKNKAELMLWIPAAKPYYRTNNVFSQNAGYSKLLVFSSWEMAPRMIAAMVSYEAERLNVDKLNSRAGVRKKKYFTRETKKRENVARLRAEREAIVTFPSQTLAQMWRPLDYAGQSITAVRRALVGKVRTKLKRIAQEYGIREGGGGAKLILALLRAMDGEDCRDSLKSIPGGAAELLVNMALGSPGVCALRLFHDEEQAAEFAGCFVSLFNKPESMAAVDALYGKGEDFYYEDVMRYCAEGNLQAVLDEYAFVLGAESGNLPASMKKAFINTAPVQIDTRESLVNHTARPRMRTHFAVGYYDAQVNEKSIQRTENVRTAFNSPFRPFVLATTSIGQEGLDFHCYCRKIMHWNLPSNAIDLEQREGRINRYLCLAIRQNVAASEFGEGPFQEDAWQEMFERAQAGLKNNNSDLVPYWCMPDDFPFQYKIERIVPMYPFSRDKLKYDRLIKVLTLYRLTMGQPRQDELLDSLGRREWSPDELNELYINLSPYSKK